MRYFIDFDRVLFDHDSLADTMQAKQLQSLYAQPELWDHLNAADFLYPDAVAFLQACTKENCTIISAYTARIGPQAKAYQTRKLHGSKIAQYVQSVIIMDGPKAPYIKCAPTESVVFIDDKYSYVQEVKLAHPNVHCIQLLRPQATRAADDVTLIKDLRVPVVHDLPAALDLVATL